LGTAGDGHSLLKAIYADQSLPLYVRMDAARIAIRHETPALAASNSRIEVTVGIADRLERARKRFATLAAERGEQPTYERQQLEAKMVTFQTRPKEEA
jgi:hypothetical protein